MKSFALISTLAAAAAASPISTDASDLKAVFTHGLGKTVTIGKSYTVDWTQNFKAYDNLDLVRQTSDGWAAEKTLIRSELKDSGHGSYVWTVESVTDANGNYSLWLDANSFPDKHHGYADLTNWFKIKKADSSDEEQVAM